MAKKLKGIKAEAYEEKKVVENEIEDEVELDLPYDIDFEEKEEEPQKKQKSKKSEPKKKQELNLDLEDEIFEADSNNQDKPKTGILMRIFNVIFIITLVIMVIISIDVICVTKYNVGPFFAIKTATYKDGGTKVYHGLGYKVIKYKQLEGRQDTQLGFWSMPYNTTPTEIQDIDLAIEFQNKPEKSGDKYYNQYLKISSTIKSINKNKNELTLEYTDPDGKYTLQIKCSLASEPSAILDFKEKQEVAVRGTVTGFALKDAKHPNTVYLKNCFVE